MPLSRLLQSLNGTCRYCGQKAALVQRGHPQCRQAHASGYQEMVQLASQAASGPHLQRGCPPADPPSKSDDGWAAPQVAESLDVALTGSSSDLPRRGWLGPCWTAARPTGIGSWTTGARPT